MLGSWFLHIPSLDQAYNCLIHFYKRRYCWLWKRPWQVEIYITIRRLLLTVLLTRRQNHWQLKWRSTRTGRKIIDKFWKMICRRYNLRKGFKITLEVTKFPISIIIPNIKVLEDYKIDQPDLPLWHLPRQHLSRRYMSILGITQLLLIRFRPNLS